MTKSILLTEGQKFGRLTVIKLDHTKERHRIKNNKNILENIEYYLCECNCGNKTIIQKENLKTGHSISCGCFKKENSKNLMITHGATNTKLYYALNHMKIRCYDKNYKYYKNYGGRGITICEEWLDKKNGVKNFVNWSMDNGYKENEGRNILSIDRIDNNGNYEPSNCRWVDMNIQNRNKRSNINITYNNETKNLKDWAKLLQIPYGTIYFRFFFSKMTIEEAFFLPVKVGNNQCLRKNKKLSGSIDKTVEIEGEARYSPRCNNCWSR